MPSHKPAFHLTDAHTRSHTRARAQDDFFAYADEVNRKYPTPITWEVGGPVEEGVTTSPSAAAPKEVPDASTTALEVPTVYAADLTWTGSAFERGVTVGVGADGRIAFVDRKGDRSSDVHGTRRLEGRALIPGFVNAHSHAFQRGLRGRGETYPRADGPDGAVRPSFWTWREAMYGLVGHHSPPSVPPKSSATCRSRKWQHHSCVLPICAGDRVADGRGIQGQDSPVLS